MGIYDDLLSLKGSGTPFDNLEQVPAISTTCAVTYTGAPPQDFIEFLVKIGYGEFGSSAYMLYSGLIYPSEIYGDPLPGMENILLFGDDFQGCNTGFRTSDWSVVEIDPSNMSIDVVAPTFQEFIRKKIAGMT